MVGWPLSVCQELIERELGRRDAVKLAAVLFAGS